MSTALEEESVKSLCSREYLKHSAWNLVSSFTLNDCCCVIGSLFLTCQLWLCKWWKTLSCADNPMTRQFKCCHFKAWKLLFYANSGCSLVTRIEKNMLKQHQSGGFWLSFPKWNKFINLVALEQNFVLNN